jgi:hypothetical protein
MRKTTFGLLPFCGSGTENRVEAVCIYIALVAGCSFQEEPRCQTSSLILKVSQPFQAECITGRVTPRRFSYI